MFIATIIIGFACLIIGVIAQGIAFDGIQPGKSKYSPQARENASAIFTLALVFGFVDFIAFIFAGLPSLIWG